MNKSPESQQQPDHQAGRDFTNPRAPLGQGVIERADPRGGAPEEGVYGRANVSADVGHGVADRAKAVSVLRKAEELMATGNPDGGSDDGRRRAIELACGRCGVRVEEYDKIVAHDEELMALQTNVFESARTHRTRM